MPRKPNLKPVIISPFSLTKCAPSMIVTTINVHTSFLRFSLSLKTVHTLISLSQNKMLTIHLDTLWCYSDMLVTNFVTIWSAPKQTSHGFFCLFVFFFGFSYITGHGTKVLQQKCISWKFWRFLNRSPQPSLDGILRRRLTGELALATWLLWDDGAMWLPKAGLTRFLPRRKRCVLRKYVNEEISYPG